MLCFATLSYMFRVYNSFNALTLCTLNAPPLPLTTPNKLKILYTTQSTGRRLCVRTLSSSFSSFSLSLSSSSFCSWARVSSSQDANSYTSCWNELLHECALSFRAALEIKRFLGAVQAGEGPRASNQFAERLRVSRH
eukprot:GHVU01113888.1.p1 GENE.GHVU01113888.1~~GHVU01113888.1.p1  ORF type:complete len:137 (-),score=8.98 GHVU01113888.1:281-691(-)